MPDWVGHFITYRIAKVSPKLVISPKLVFSPKLVINDLLKQRSGRLLTPVHHP